MSEGRDVVGINERRIASSATKCSVQTRLLASSPDLLTKFARMVKMMWGDEWERFERASGGATGFEKWEWWGGAAMCERMMGRVSSLIADERAKEAESEEATSREYLDCMAGCYRTSREIDLDTCYYEEGEDR